MKTFTFAGTARDTDGTVVFRATNREGYARILAKEGKTDINIMSLPHAMTKADAAAFVASATAVKAEPAVVAEKPAVKAKPAKAADVPADVSEAA